MKSIVFALLITTGLVLSACSNDTATLNPTVPQDSTAVDTLQNVPPDTSAHLEPREKAVDGTTLPEVKN